MNKHFVCLFGRRKSEINAGLHKLLIKTLDWRVKLFYTYDWLLEHTSFVIRGKCVFFNPGKVWFSALFFPFCNSATIQQFKCSVQQRSSIDSKHGSTQVMSQPCLTQFFSHLYLPYHYLPLLLVHITVVTIFSHLVFLKHAKDTSLQDSLTCLFPLPGKIFDQIYFALSLYL